MSTTRRKCTSGDRGPQSPPPAPETAKPGQKALRCDGWRRTGNAFSFGPMIWTQCENDAVVLLTVEQEGGIVEDSPACAACWEEGRKLGLKQLDARPIMPKEKT